MRSTNNPSLRPTLCGLVLVLAVTALASQVARAVPYASGVTKSGSTVTFVLNQNAQGLVVLRDGANPTYPGTNAGPLSFDMTGYTSFQIIVTGNTATAWTQISDDNRTQSKYYSPRGVTVDTNPKRSTFGQIIVAEAMGGSVAAGGRTTTDGLYIMSADQGDIHGQGNTAYGGTMDWTTGGSVSPWRISMNHADPLGQDYTIYIADWSDPHSGIWTADALNPGTAFNELLDNTGRDADGLVLAGGGVGPDPLHGSVAAAPWVEGTGANRVMYSLDEDVRLGNILQYDIGTTTSGYSTAPTDRVSDTPDNIENSRADAVRDQDGSWWIAQYRYTDSSGVPSLSHWADNSSTPSWVSGPGTVPLDLAYGSLDINDRDNLLVMGALGKVYVINISNPDNPTLADTIIPANTPEYTEYYVQDVAFDAAGNIYIVSSSTEKLRIYSPGGYTVATTGSDSTFSLTKPSVNVSVTATTGTTSMDLNQPPGVFTLTRTGDAGVALPVGYTLTGTATNGAQYQLLSGAATFQAGSSSTDVLVTAKPYSPAGPTRSVILTLNNSNSYSPTAPASATVWIVDTNKPSIHIAVRDTQFYERTNDLARFTLTRWGDTNAYLSLVNVTYAGTAIEGTHFYGDTYATMSYGDETKDVFVHPICDGVLTGPMTVTATVAAAGDGSYTVDTPATSGAVTRVDADDLPETVLFADNFDTDSSANWTVRFASRNGIEDYTTRWAFDYSTEAIPPAPHSRFTSSTGLKMTVNKNEPTAGGAAGLNLYPKGKSFSGNYALRFDMYLKVGSAASTTEYALCGINHSGNQTNWLRGPSTANTPNDGVGGDWPYDGLWVSIEADASGADDFMFLSAPAVSPAGIWGPTTYATANATQFGGLFKSPPFFDVGSPANSDISGTPIWADVELSQIGNIVTLKINKSVILSYTNTVTANNGNIMIGYDDAYDSIMTADSSVYIDNLRVISLAGPVISKIVNNVGNLEITFAANPADVPAQFTLQQSSPLPTGAYADTTSTITSLGGGAFKAVKAAGTGPTFYRIRRLY